MIVQIACYFRSGSSATAAGTTATIDILSKSATILISICGDGRCLFRCIALFVNKNLLHAKRATSGRPRSTEDDKTETELADKIRADVVALILKNSEYIETKSEDLPFLLDNKLNEPGYVSVKSRCQAMRNEAEYAGMLEILAAAYILDVQICIYIDQSDTDSYTPYAMLPTVVPNTHSKMHLLHHVDSRSKSGHFDVPFKDNEDSNIVSGREKKSSFVSGREKKSSFIECLCSATGCLEDNTPIIHTPGNNLPHNNNVLQI